jgi:hypothetical protein
MSVLLVGNSNSYSFRTKKQFCRGERSRSLTFLPVWSNFILGILQVSDPKELRNIFWPLRDDNRPHRSISSNNTIYVLCWAFVGRMLGVCWAHVGSVLGLGRCWAYVVTRWAMLGPYWASEACRAILDPCWAYVGPCWASVAPMLGHLEPEFGNLANFRFLKKRGKTLPPPQAKT